MIVAKKRPFPTEVALCAAFIECTDKRVWTPYAETAGWDILLVRRIDGFQIGIQAKLSLNVDVVNQAIEEYGHWTATREGPDCRAVLVPSEGTGKLSKVCDYLGLVVITVLPPFGRGVYGSRIHPILPERPDNWRGGGTDWHEWAPWKRHKLPDYIPDVAAGAAAPIRLTDWKIGAIKIAVLLEKRGFILRSDFKHLQMDHRRWIAQEWVVPSRNGYVAKAAPDFKKQHPKVYEKIAGEFDKWKPPAGLL